MEVLDDEAKETGDVIGKHTDTPPRKEGCGKNKLISPVRVREAKRLSVPSFLLIVFDSVPYLDTVQPKGTVIVKSPQ